MCAFISHIQPGPHSEQNPERKWEVHPETGKSVLCDDSTTSCSQPGICVQKCTTVRGSISKNMNLFLFSVFPDEEVLL